MANVHKTVLVSVLRRKIQGEFFGPVNLLLFLFFFSFHICWCPFVCEKICFCGYFCCKRRSADRISLSLWNLHRVGGRTRSKRVQISESAWCNFHHLLMSKFECTVGRLCLRRLLSIKNLQGIMHELSVFGFHRFGQSALSFHLFNMHDTREVCNSFVLICWR